VTFEVLTSGGQIINFSWNMMLCHWECS